MAGTRICRNTYCNLLTGKDEFVERALIEGSHTSNFTFVVFYASTLALSSPGLYTDIDLQRASRLALELFVKGLKYAQLQAIFGSTLGSINALFE